MRNDRRSPIIATGDSKAKADAGTDEQSPSMPSLSATRHISNVILGPILWSYFWRSDRGDAGQSIPTEKVLRRRQRGVQQLPGKFSGGRQLAENAELSVYDLLLP